MENKKKFGVFANSEGSMALEYVLISGFTAIVTFAAIAHVKKIIVEKSTAFNASLGIEMEGLPDNLP